MDIRQLRAVVAIIDCGGVTPAAEELHVAQPSLSQTIRTLERELGVDLFHRVGRRLVLSAAGEALLGPARQVLRDLDNVAASVAEVKGLAGGHLDLVALPTLAVDPVARLVGAFRVAYPQVTVRLAEPEGSAEVIERLEDGRSEVGLTELPVAPPKGHRLQTRPLMDQDVLAVLPPGSPEPAGGILPVRQLAGVPLVTTPVGTSSRALVDGALARAALSPVIAVETQQREALLPLVLAGAGTALLPRPLAEQAARQGAVVAELRPPLRRTVGLIFREGALSPAARAFIEIADPGNADPGTADPGNADPGNADPGNTDSSHDPNASSSSASQSTGPGSTAHSSPSQRTRT
jgi:DNA-binding transcriptional LysR family regulator